jgi:hypothetical protein
MIGFLSMLFAGERVLGSAIVQRTVDCEHSLVCLELNHNVSRIR